MSRQIFVNLPVADLDRSTAFYQALGATKNEQFSDETASCIVLSDDIFIMLLTHVKWRQFTAKRIPNAHETAQVMLALSEDSREGVDRFLERAQAAGGVIDPAPVQDHGFMYGRDFEDPDGHIWEVFWMDMSAVPAPVD